MRVSSSPLRSYFGSPGLKLERNRDASGSRRLPEIFCKNNDLEQPASHPRGWLKNRQKLSSLC
jgi:hypothetical protein